MAGLARGLCGASSRARRSARGRDSSFVAFSCRLWLLMIGAVLHLGGQRQLGRDNLCRPVRRSPWPKAPALGARCVAVGLVRIARRCSCSAVDHSHGRPPSPTAWRRQRLQAAGGLARSGGRRSARSRRGGKYAVVAADNRSVMAELLYYRRSPRPAASASGTATREPQSLRDDHAAHAARQPRVLWSSSPEDAARGAPTFESNRRSRTCRPVGGPRHVRVMSLYDARFYRGPQHPRCAGFA
jgi:hypothetical protein